MNRQELEAFAKEAAKSIKTPEDLNNFSRMLNKITVEAALDEHLGYDKHQKSGHNNSRNGYSSKMVQTEDGSFVLDTPRDRNGEFEPQLIKKH